MVKIEELTKNQVIDMLNDLAEEKVRLRNLDDKYDEIFCINSDYTIHIWKIDVFKQIAKILEVPVLVSPYNERCLESCKPNLGELIFKFQYGEKIFDVFTLYKDESEVVG